MYHAEGEIHVCLCPVLFDKNVIDGFIKYSIIAVKKKQIFSVLKPYCKIFN